MHTSTLWTPRRRLLLWALLIIAGLLALFMLFFAQPSLCGCSLVEPTETIVPGLSG
jgi:hypothetical protein